MKLSETQLRRIIKEEMDSVNQAPKKRGKAKLGRGSMYDRIPEDSPDYGKSGDDFWSVAPKLAVAVNKTRSACNAMVEGDQKWRNEMRAACEELLSLLDKLDGKPGKGSVTMGGMHYNGR